MLNKISAFAVRHDFLWILWKSSREIATRYVGDSRIPRQVLVARDENGASVYLQSFPRHLALFIGGAVIDTGVTLSALCGSVGTVATDVKQREQQQQQQTNNKQQTNPAMKSAAHTRSARTYVRIPRPAFPSIVTSPSPPVIAPIYSLKRPSFHLAYPLVRSLFRPARKFALRFYVIFVKTTCLGLL